MGEENQVKKWTYIDNHVQNNEYVEHQYVKMYFNTNQFPELSFFVLHNKPHGAWVLGKDYCIHFDTILGYVTCAIRCITCVCN